MNKQMLESFDRMEKRNLKFNEVVNESHTSTKYEYLVAIEDEDTDRKFFNTYKQAYAFAERLAKNPKIRSKFNCNICVYQTDNNWPSCRKIACIEIEPMNESTQSVDSLNEYYGTLPMTYRDEIEARGYQPDKQRNKHVHIKDINDYFKIKIVEDDNRTGVRISVMPGKYYEGINYDKSLSKIPNGYSKYVTTIDDIINTIDKFERDFQNVIPKSIDEPQISKCNRGFLNLLSFLSKGVDNNELRPFFRKNKSMHVEVKKSIFLDKVIKGDDTVFTLGVAPDIVISETVIKNQERNKIVEYFINLKRFTKESLDILGRDPDTFEHLLDALKALAEQFLDNKLFDTKPINEATGPLNKNLNKLKESLSPVKFNKIQKLINECLKEGIEVEITIPKNKCKNLNESLIVFHGTKND